MTLRQVAGTVLPLIALKCGVALVAALLLVLAL